MLLGTGQPPEPGPGFALFGSGLLGTGLTAELS